MPDPEKLSPQQFRRFSEFIYRQSGIRVDASKITLVSNRIRRRLRAGSFPDFDAYYAHLTAPGGSPELEQFLDAVTTNETHFFRTPAHFDWFKGDFLTETILDQRKTGRPQELRVWSAACSTGEEAYSLSICLAENSLRLKNWKVSVLGTDISEAVLKEARLGVYRDRALDAVNPLQLKRYFDVQPDGTTWKVKPSVREPVDFRRHNLMEPLRLPPFDCIFIRNVLIYFDRESKQVVIKHLMNSLARGGYLVVGPSEGIYDMLDPLVKRATYLYQKP
ncbi:MAG: protein-glutamate O-methyltransferase CheR [Planctomycetes bacterium]|nr:protein-glutamate O-methyltransferase CheR [Planctomycetota bacterium]